MTAMERLRQELPPPGRIFGAQGDWSQVERELGLSLPTDYKEFISTYGSGKVCGFVSVYSPFVRNINWSFGSYLEQCRSAYQALVDTRVLDGIPYPVLPEMGGLLPFGTTENGNCLNWLTVGPPDQWELIAWDPDYLKFRATGYRSLSAYLADIVGQRCGLVTDDPPFDWLNPSHTFTPIDYDGPPFTTPSSSVASPKSSSKPAKKKASRKKKTD